MDYSPRSHYKKLLRDQLEEIPVTMIYVALCWASVGICIGLLLFILTNATLTLSEKGYYLCLFLLSLFGVTATKRTFVISIIYVINKK